MIWFVLLLMSVTAFDCMEYARSVHDNNDMISREEREIYLPTLCSATALCHANPVLSSFEAFQFDIVQCYKSRMFNLDMSLFAAIRPNVTEYIDVRQQRREKAARYDALNYEAKDAMVAIIDICRLRDSYLREFQYSKPPILTGDIALLLEHNGHLFDVNSKHQLLNIHDIANTTLLQLNTAKEWQLRLEAAYTALKEVLALLEEKQGEFSLVSTLIKKNVVMSLLKLTN